MTADPGPTPDRAEPSTDYDDPAYYEPHGLKPQCTYIVHWHSCRLDAGHSGRHSPGRIEAEARASAPEQGEPPADDENSGYVSELIEHDRAASGAQAAASRVPQVDREHAAWCWLPKDHKGLCEGDQ